MQDPQQRDVVRGLAAPLGDGLVDLRHVSKRTTALDQAAASMLDGLAALGSEQCDAAQKAARYLPAGRIDGPCALDVEAHHRLTRAENMWDDVFIAGPRMTPSRIIAGQPHSWSRSPRH
jgi:hypothetical protein